MINYEQALQDAKLEQAQLEQELKTLRAQIIQVTQELDVHPTLEDLQIAMDKTREQVVTLEKALQDKITEYYLKVGQ